MTTPWNHGSGTLDAERPTSAAFTLVELAIAVAVVFTGVLALFSLITSGLDSSARAVADTQAALFADDVFNGLSAANLEAAEAGVSPAPEVASGGGGTLYWRKFWHDFGHQATNLPLSANVIWQQMTIPSARPPTAPIMVRAGTPGNAEIYSVRYATKALHIGGVTNILNHALRYRLVVDLGASGNPSGSGWYTFTGATRTQVLANTNVLVTLYVWDGEFGGTNDPLVFYTEYDNPGDL